MATEKQIAANRANAKRSTGPKTFAGKLKSSRNAYRHGLSGPVQLDPAALGKIGAIALFGTGRSSDRLALAADFARAQQELVRIRSRCTELMEKIELDDMNSQELRRVAALDRYERYCLTRRRRAAYEL